MAGEAILAAEEALRAAMMTNDVETLDRLLDIEGTFDGGPANGRFRYTRVWCQRPDGWRIVAGHMSAVPADATAPASAPVPAS